MTVGLISQSVLFVNMGEIVGRLRNVSEHEGYVVEYLGDAPFDDTVSRTLDKNFVKISHELGEDKVYVKHTGDEEELKELLKKFNIDTKYPVLLILDTHPHVILEKYENKEDTINMKKEYKGIAFQFEQVENDTEVTYVLRTISDSLQNEHFMRELNWERSKVYLQNKLESILNFGGVAITIVTAV